MHLPSKRQGLTKLDQTPQVLDGNVNRYRPSRANLLDVGEYP